MKSNRYIYFVPFEKNQIVLFNGLNKEFIIIDSNAKDSYLQLLKTPDSYKESHPSLITYLKSLKFILDDHEDEHEYLKAKRDDYIHYKEYKTTILPTFECNYNCWYCIQKHEPIKIDESKIELIIKHVKKYLVKHNIESYVLSWFGGEPLTQIETVNYVSNVLKEFCIKHNIEFSGAVTTNGALLNDKTIETLALNDINYYQIAIDGDEKTHNLNKYDKLSDSSFRLILTNIVNLLNANDKAHVVLRVNYTIATLNSKELVSDICKYIPLSHRNRIIVDLQKVWQIKEEKVDIDKLKLMQQSFVENGFELSTGHLFSMCYVEKEHYNMFYYNGGVEKCDKRPINQLRGYLNENGDIVWKEKPIIHDYNLFDEGCVCNDCAYYPLCYGGCPVLREDRIKENGGTLPCGYAGDFSIFEHRILDYCWRVINNRKLKL